MHQMEQLSFLVRSSNSQQNFNYEFRKQIKFEFGLNFNGVQTFLEKSDKFSKIPSSHDIVEYEFILTHLYSNIGSSFTSEKRTSFNWYLLFQTGKGVFDTELDVLFFHPFDMQTSSPKIEEDIEFPKVLSAKQKAESWTTKDIEIIAVNPPWLKPVQGVLPSNLQTLYYNLGDMHNLTPKIQGDMTFQR
jgi:hypothetical protein